MKANEAPEKLYCVATEGGYYLTAIKSEPPFTEAVEYTRTDVFIEKACKWLQENKDKYLYNTGEKGEYIPTCSGKMIEEFRKYMKGE
jgi:hypothetical protein